MRKILTLIIAACLIGCTKPDRFLSGDAFIFPSDNYFLVRADEFCYRQWEGMGFVSAKKDTLRFEIDEDGKIPDSAFYRKTILAKKGRGAFIYVFDSPFIRKDNWENKWFLFVITYANNNRPGKIKYWFRLADPYCFSPY